MDNEIDQAISSVVSNDNKGNESSSTSFDDTLDSALLDMVPTLPDF